MTSGDRTALRSDLFPSAFKWVLGVELELSDLAANEPSHCPYYRSCYSKAQKQQLSRVPSLSLGDTTDHIICLLWATSSH